MDLPIEVPGLDTIVPVLEQSTILVVEGGPDLAKSFFVRRLCRTAAHAGLPVTFLTSRDAQDIGERFANENGGADGARMEIVERDTVKELGSDVPRGGLLAVDSFSFLALDLTPNELARLLRDVRRDCLAKGSNVVLTTDAGMFDPRAEAVVTHLGEGLIAFHAQEGNEGIVRFLRIPKWADGRFVDRNIYYEFDGRRIAIDLRNRVL